MLADIASTAAPPPLRRAVLPNAALGADEASLQVRFPQGLPGFPMVNNYLLRQAGPSGDLLELAALGQPELRFLVLPYIEGWLPIDHADLLAVAATVGIASADLAVLLMVNVQRDRHTGSADISVNLRAPILIDMSSRLAAQPILADPAYDIRHPLRRLAAAAPNRHPVS